MNKNKKIIKNKRCKHDKITITGVTDNLNIIYTCIKCEVIVRPSKTNKKYHIVQTK